MNLEIDGKKYDVIIIKKNNKNTYVRIKEDFSIVVTTGYFVTKKQILRILNENINSIRKMLNRQQDKNEKSKTFFYLGKSYDIIEMTSNSDVKITEDKIYIPNKMRFEKWYKENIVKIFEERLKYIFNIFEESSECPTLKIRSMKTRWGVYNRVKHNVTLNTELIKYDIEKIDYVIIHELCHIVYFDHSKNFWNLLSRYCPNYKNIRKELKK